MSQFTFSCPHCRRPLTADSVWVGREVRCPSCSIPFVVAKPAPPVLRVAPPVLAAENVCPYCKTKIGAAESTCVCPVCHTPHHADCWNENRGCTVFGCTMAPPDEERIIVGGDRGAPIPPQAPTSPGYLPPYRPRVTAPGATSSLVLALVGFFICGPIFGLLAISEANRAKRMIQMQPDVYNGEGLATAGLVLGIIELVLGGLLVFMVFASSL